MTYLRESEGLAMGTEPDSEMSSVCANPYCREAIPVKRGRPQLCCTPKCLRDAKRDAARLKRSLLEALSYDPSTVTTGEVRLRRAQAARLSWRLRPYAGLFLPAESFADRIDLSELLPGYRPKGASLPSQSPRQ